MQKEINWPQRPPMVERKRQRKLSGYICCYFYNFICFISLYALVSSLFSLHFSNAKTSRSWSRGPMTAGAPCHGTIGTMGSPALNPYYILWHKSYKVNNNLQFILGHHPYRLSAKHTGIKKTTSCRRLPPLLSADV